MYCVVLPHEKGLMVSVTFRNITFCMCHTAHLYLSVVTEFEWLHNIRSTACHIPIIPCVFLEIIQPITCKISNTPSSTLALRGKAPPTFCQSICTLPRLRMEHTNRSGSPGLTVAALGEMVTVVTAAKNISN